MLIVLNELVRSLKIACFEIWIEHCKAAINSSIVLSDEHVQIFYVLCNIIYLRYTEGK